MTDRLGTTNSANLEPLTPGFEEVHDARVDGEDVTVMAKEKGPAPANNAQDYKQTAAQLKNVFKRIQSAANTQYSETGKKNNIARGTKKAFKTAEKSMKNDKQFVANATTAIKQLHNVRPDLVQQACQGDEYKKLIQPMMAGPKAKKGILKHLTRKRGAKATGQYKKLRLQGNAADMANDLTAPKPEVTVESDPKKQGAVYSMNRGRKTRQYAAMQMAVNSEISAPRPEVRKRKGKLLQLGM